MKKFSTEKAKLQIPPPKMDWNLVLKIWRLASQGDDSFTEGRLSSLALEQSERIGVI